MAQGREQVSQVIEKLYSDVESYIERTLIPKYKLTKDDAFTVRCEIMDAISKRWLDGSAVIVELDDPESLTATLQKLCPNLAKALEKEASLNGQSLSDIIENDAELDFMVVIETLEEAEESRKAFKRASAEYDNNPALQSRVKSLLSGDDLLPSVEPKPNDWMN